MKTDTPDIRCPRCGEDRMISETDDGIWITCDVCAYTWTKHRPPMSENDRALLKRHHRIVTGKDKPWGTY